MPAQFSNYGIIWGFYLAVAIVINWFVKHRIVDVLRGGCRRTPGHFSRLILFLSTATLMTGTCNTFAGAWYSDSDPPRWTRGAWTGIRFVQLVVLPMTIWVGAVSSLATPPQSPATSLQLDAASPAPAEDEVRLARRRSTHLIVQTVAALLCIVFCSLGFYAFGSTMNHLEPIDRLGITRYDVNPATHGLLYFGLQGLLATSFFNLIAGACLWARFGSKTLCLCSAVSLVGLAIAMVLGDLAYFFAEPMCEAVLLSGLMLVEKWFIAGSAPAGLFGYKQINA
eukprot:Amastigsp_a676497_404.p1 type:complete len:282 gc:universal Amastigsp_a676497_404:44-889(+)